MQVAIGDSLLVEESICLVAFGVDGGERLELLICLLVEVVAFDHVVRDDLVEHLVFLFEQLVLQL